MSILQSRYAITSLGGENSDFDKLLLLRLAHRDLRPGDVSGA